MTKQIAINKLEILIYLGFEYNLSELVTLAIFYLDIPINQHNDGVLH